MYRGCVFQEPTSIKRKAVREALGSEEGVAAARLSRRLVALQTDVDVPVVRWAEQRAKPTFWVSRPL